MPRQSSRRAQSTPSDHIEEHILSQQQDDDAVDEDEETLPRRSSKAPKSKVKKATPRQDEDDQSGAEDGNGGDMIPFDEDTFGNQPLNKNEGSKLTGIAADWAMIEKNVRNSAPALLNDVASAVAELRDDEAAEKELIRLDNLMREMVDIDEEISAHKRTLEELHQHVIRGEEISDILDRYENDVKGKIDKYNKKTTRQKYGRNQHYADFRQAIHEVQNPDDAMPPVVEFLPREKDDVSDDDDDDILVGGVMQDFKCPITLTFLVDPLTSVVCSHSFSGEAIRQMLGSNKATKKACPAAGCRKMICYNDLKPDKALERKVKNAQRRARQREDDSDAEEIVE